MILRDYQQQSIEAVRASMRSGKKRPILVLPTGAGKTVCFSYIAHSAGLKGNRVIILVHRQELIYQTSEKLTMFGIEHGVISPEFEHTDYPVQIAMVQTLSRDTRLSKTVKPNLLIVDECHHSNATNYKKIVDWAECPVIGVTATPCRLDGRGLKEIFDDICVGVTVSNLLERGFLSDYRYFGMPVKSELLKNMKVSMGDYSADTIKDLAGKVSGDVVETWEEKAINQPTIVFCPSVASAESIATQFRSAGYEFYSLDGSMDRSKRKKLINDLAEGKITGITSCDVISEGTDIPVASCAVLLRKTKSTSLFMQQVGRVLRPVEGKKAIVIDMVQNYQEHGMPCEEREWSLEGKKKQEKNPEDIEIKFKQCKKCFAVSSPASVQCDECGEPFKVMTRKEMLFASGYSLAEVEKYSKPIKKVDHFTLEKYCESKGIKKGFAYFVRRDIDGKFDKFLEDFKLWREANLISNGKSILS